MVNENTFNRGKILNKWTHVGTFVNHRIWLLLKSEFSVQFCANSRGGLHMGQISVILWRCFSCFTHTTDLLAVALSKQAISIAGSWCLSLSAMWPLLLWPHAMLCLRRSLRLKIKFQARAVTSHTLRWCWFALTFYFHWHVL